MMRPVFKEDREGPEGRPGALRDIARKYPVGSRVAVREIAAYVTGYSSYDDEVTVSLSHLDPAVDYEAAMATRFYVPARDLP